MISANSYENCFDSLAGTPSKKRNSTALAPSSARTPASSAKRNQRGDRFIPQRSAMDLDVSHFELTRATDSENNANVNASPAKEDVAVRCYGCCRLYASAGLCRLFRTSGRSRG